MKAFVHHSWQIIVLLLLAFASNTAATPTPRRNFFWKHNDRPPGPLCNSTSSVPDKKTTGFWGDVKDVNRHKIVHKDDQDHHHDDSFKAAISSKDASPTKPNNKQQQAQPPTTEEHHELHEHKLLLEFSHQLMDSLPVQ